MYRLIHDKIYTDAWFIDLEPDAKLLFIYLFSNRNVSTCGIYELPLPIIATETGIERPRILDILTGFAALNRAHYENGIVWLPNLRKYQDSGSIKTKVRMRTDLEAIPDCRLKRVAEAAIFGTGKISGYPIDTVSAEIPGQEKSASDQEKEKDQEKDQDQDQDQDQEKEQTSGKSPVIAQAEKAAPPSSSSANPDFIDLGSVAIIPDTPRQAQEHPLLKIFTSVCGRVPGKHDYRPVIDTIAILGATYPRRDDLIAFLGPYWIAWSTRKTSEGKPYDQRSIVWLTEWAINREIPPERTTRPTVKSNPAQDAVRAELAELRKNGIKQRAVRNG